MSKIIVLAPCHGGNEPGATANVYIEKDLNLQVSQKPKPILEKHGFTVHTTRETDTNPTLQQRGQFAKDKKADFFVSIHFNAYTSTARGAEVIYSYGSEQSKQVAEIFLDEIVKLGIPKRTVYTRKSDNGDYNWYGVLRHSYPVPGIILEPLFLTNKEDIKFLQKDNFIDNLVEAYARAVCKYFSIEYKGVNKVPQWKKDIIKEAYNNGIITDKAWIEKAEESATIWFVCAVVINLFKKLKKN